jgi:hypothetical protein
VGVTDAAAIVAAIPYIGYLRTLPADSVFANLAMVTSEGFYALAGLAQLVAILVAAVFFIRWFYLVHSNLRQLSDEPTKYSTQWTIWGFFVPLLNLIRPQQVMREVWAMSHRAWNGDPSRVADRQQPKDRVNLWWGWFLSTCILGNVVGRIAWRAVTAQDTLIATWLTLASDAVDIIAVIVAIALVSCITDLQRPLLDRKQ